MRFVNITDKKPYKKPCKHKNEPIFDSFMEIFTGKPYKLGCHILCELKINVRTLPHLVIFILIF